MLRCAAMSTATLSPLPAEETLDFVRRRWQDDVLPALSRCIEIPAKSPDFDLGVVRPRPHRPGGGPGR